MQQGTRVESVLKKHNDLLKKAYKEGSERLGNEIRKGSSNELGRKQTTKVAGNLSRKYAKEVARNQAKICVKR